MEVLTKIRRTPALIWAIALGIGCLLLATAPGSASSGTIIHVGTGSAQAGQSVSTNVTASIASNDSVNGFDITLGFDPAVATAASITLSSGWTALPVTTPIDNGSGLVHVAGFQLGTGCGGGSSCAMFSVSWHGVAGGTSSVHVTVQQLAGSNGGANGTLSSVGAVGGSVTVTGSPTGVTTQSPTATATPTKSAVATSTAATQTSVTTATATSPATTQTPPAASATTQPKTPSAAATPPPVQSAGDTSGSATAVSTPVDSAATDTPAPDPATPAGVITSDTAPAVIATQPPSATTAAAAPTASSGVLGSAGPNVPKPPATGNGGMTYGPQGNSMRLAGFALIALSVLLLLDRGIRFTGSRRMVVARIAPSGSTTPNLSATSSIEPAPISEVVDRYLAEAESRAGEMLDPGSSLWDNNGGDL